MTCAISAYNVAGTSSAGTSDNAQLFISGVGLAASGSKCASDWQIADLAEFLDTTSEGLDVIQHAGAFLEFFH